MGVAASFCMSSGLSSMLVLDSYLVSKKMCRRYALIGILVYTYSSGYGVWV